MEQTKVDISKSYILGVHRSDINPFGLGYPLYSDGSHYYFVLNKKNRSEEIRTEVVPFYKFDTSLDFGALQEKRNLPQLYWFQNPVPAFTPAKGFYLEASLRTSLEAIIGGSQSFENPALGIQQEFYREDITVGLCQPEILKQAVKKWYTLLQEKTEKLLADYFRQGSPSHDLKQHVSFLERLAPYVHTKFMEEAALREILAHPLSDRLNILRSQMHDIQAVFTSIGIEVQYFIDEEHARAALDALQRKILEQDGEDFQ